MSEANLLKHHIKKFLSDESGATAIEYGLIAAGIALAIIAAVNGLGTTLNTQFHLDQHLLSKNFNSSPSQAIAQQRTGFRVMVLSRHADQSQFPKGMAIGFQL
jgi:pilus assembly protein Flp/PilA